MLVHTVMFVFNDENKAHNMIRVKGLLEGLPLCIETLDSMEVGIDISRSDRSCDMVLVALFEDHKGLEFYATHPAHLEVIEVIKSVTTLSRVVDYVRD